MRRCLGDKALVLLHEGDGRPADRSHLEGCARCADRYRRLTDDLRVIGVVLASDPAPAAVPSRAAWPRWVAAAAVTFALVIGLNLLFAREWGRVAWRTAPEPAGAGGATTEELIAAVEAMTTDEPPWVEAAGTRAGSARGASAVEASVADLYATVAGEEACESLAASPGDGCDQLPAAADTPGAGFEDLDS